MTRPGIYARAWEMLYHRTAELSPGVEMLVTRLMHQCLAQAVKEWDAEQPTEPAQP